MIKVEFAEGEQVIRDYQCGECQGELSLAYGGAYGVEGFVVICHKDHNHSTLRKRETVTQEYRQGKGVPVVVAQRIEDKMLPGIKLDTALSLLKIRFPRADLDDPSAALFLIDCWRLDLDPFLGEIYPVTFKSKDKKTGIERKIVQPLISEEGYLSLCARACPERWVGAPTTQRLEDKVRKDYPKKSQEEIEAITKAIKKDLCGDENAFVWVAKGKVRIDKVIQDTAEAYGWLKTEEWEKAKQQGTPAGDLPGNQARVRGVKRWVRENFAEAKAKMKQMTNEWLTRARGVAEVQQIIEAEYRIVTEERKQITEKGNVANAAAEGEPKPDITGEGFSIDIGWLKESQRRLKWTEQTMLTFITSQYKVGGKTVAEALGKLTRKQAEDFTREINSRVEKKQPSLL